MKGVVCTATEDYKEDGLAKVAAQKSAFPIMQSISKRRLVTRFRICS